MSEPSATPSTSNCPWGNVICRQTVQPGVVYVTTTRHSGYHVSAEVRSRLPEQWQREWYENDYEAALLAYYLDWEQKELAAEILMLQFPDWVGE